MDIIVDTLQNNETLTELDMQHNGIYADHMTTLLDGIQEKKKCKIDVTNRWPEITARYELYNKSVKPVRGRGGMMKGMMKGK